MGLWKEALRRIAYLRRRSRFDEELEQEAEFHIETRADELAAAGLPRRDALARARREFGSGARMREDSRSAWQFAWIEDLASDLRYAGRSFRRNPAFAATAIGCLALGIGANTTIFDLASEVLFSQPSVRDPRTVIHIRVGGNSHAPLPVYRFLRDAGIFTGLGGENEESELNWRHGAVTERIFAVRVTDNFFTVTGVPLAIGRPIRPGEANAVVLSHGFWERRFGGDLNVIGAGMILDGALYTVAGVLPRDHRTVTGFGFSPDLYAPVTDAETAVALYARMPEGMTRPVAEGRLRVACREYDRLYPSPHHWAEAINVMAVGGFERLKGENLMSVAAFFGMLMAVVGLVLLIACANVASLLLARASSRAQEMAVRLSIGAGRGRIIRQLLAESLLLAICGTASGLALNLCAAALLSRIRLPLPIPIQFLIQPDWGLMAYAAAVALVCCLAAGLAPAIQSARTAVYSAMKRDDRQVGGACSFRGALVVVQLAVSIVLLSAGLLFVRNLVSASTTDPGFDARHTVWAYLRLVPEADRNPEKKQAVIAEGLTRLRSLPGVEAAAIADVIPLNDQRTWATQVSTDLGGPMRLQFNVNYVGADYFRVMGIRILRGREFLRQDGKGAPRVAILNESMARRLFGNLDPVGHTLRFQGGPILIAGVAADSKYFTLGENHQSAYYESYAQTGSTRGFLNFMVRSHGDPEALVASVRSTLAELDPTAALEVKPMSRALTFALLPSRVGAAVLGSMGLLGLALASIGLYGTLLYAISRRTREIGLRVALGAMPGSILGLVLRQSGALVGIGVAIGTMLAIFAVRPLAMFLIPEVRTGDPGNFLAVALVLGLVAALATAAPALRAIRVDPLVALRHE